MDKGKLILILVAVLGVLILAVLLLAKVFFGGITPVTLTYWGLWEPATVYSSVISEYQRLHPNVKIVYQQQSPIQYRERLQAAISKPGGPDIFRFHNSWLPMLKDLAAPVPDSAYNLATYKQTFYPVAQRDLFYNGHFYGIPLEVDTLALYINNDIFAQRGVGAPTSWPQEFSNAAMQLTVSAGGRIQRAGAGVGNAGNVTHWQDILGLMMLQNGVDMKDPTGNLAVDALNFYTGLETVSKVWDETQDESKLAFAKGNLAMFFGYHWDYFDIKEMSKGTNLNFRVVPVPQLSGSNVSYASYWVEGVSRQSKNQEAAWDFLKFISSKEELAKLYQAETLLRGFGEPYGRVDMADLLQTDPVASVFVSQAKTAQSWYLDSLTWDGDTGINTRIGNYFADAINSVIRTSQDSSQALDTAGKGVNQVLGSYGLSQGSNR